MTGATVSALALDLAWRIALAWAVACGVACLLRRHSARLRHALWLGVLAVPLVPPLQAGGRAFRAACVGTDGGGHRRSFGDARWRRG